MERMKFMRIMMLSWEFPPRVVGGLAQHVYELSRSLVKQGCAVDVVTTLDENLPSKEVMEGIGVWRVAPYHGRDKGFVDWVHRFNFALLEQGVVLGNQNKYDLIHAHDWLVAYAARALKYIYTIPMLATVHATEFGRNNGLHTDDQRYISDIEWWLTYEAWKVICCSKYMREEIQYVFQVPEDKIEIVPNGIRPEAYQLHGEGSVLSPDLYNPGEKIIFFIGRLVREKGVQVLLEAAPQILSRFPQTRFIIAGRGPFEGNLHALSHRLGLDEKVTFCGYIDDRARNELYHLASVAVFPSLYEPFGIVALEGMVSGAPVVVTTAGGLDEIVEHEKDGLKAFPDDPSSLATQICSLLEDEDRAAVLAENAYLKATQIYSWDKIAERTMNIYKEIIFSPENKHWQQNAQKARSREDDISVGKGEKPSGMPYFV
jgi:glycogen(starch) synthase